MLLRAARHRQDASRDRAGDQGLPSRTPCRVQTAQQWVDRLEAAQHRNALDDELRRIERYGLIVVDEIGYLPLERQAANLLFALVARRYERGSIIVTSNRGFEAWGEILGDAMVAAALIDRLIHHAHIVTLKGKSYGSGRGAPGPRQWSTIGFLILAHYSVPVDQPGEIGALLRREGLYLSLLTEWVGSASAGRWRRLSVPEAVRSRSARGADRRAATAPERAERELEKARRVIDVQRNVSALLGALLAPRGAQGSTER